MIFNFRRRKERIALPHDAPNLEIPWHHISAEIQVWSWKSEQSRFKMFQSRNVEGKSSSAVIVIYHTTDKAMMERKTRYEVQELLELQNKWNRWQYEEKMVRQNQREGNVLKLNLMKPLSKKHFTKFVQGDFWWVRSSDFTRKIYRNASDRIGVIKNKQFIDNSSSDTQKEAFWEEISKTMAAIWNTLFNVHCNLGKSRFGKDLAKKLTKDCQFGKSK